MPDGEEEGRQAAGVERAEHGDGRRFERTLSGPAGRQRPRQHGDEPEGREVGPAVHQDRVHPRDDHAPVDQRGHGRGAHDAQRTERADLPPLGQIEQLACAQGGGDDEQQRQREPAVPHDGQRHRDRDGGEPDAADQIAVHQTVTRPNRRSRR